MIEPGSRSRPISRPIRIAVIDNRDSFVFNLVRYLEELGAKCSLFSNDHFPQELDQSDGVMISPGPGAPEAAGRSMEIISWANSQARPLLGVCLGHQAIATTFGGKVAGAERLIHGATSRINHDGVGIFSGIPQEFNAARYHSLAVQEVPASLIATAWSEDGEVMGVRHINAPIVGVQFHPESILTEYGHDLLRNWLASVAEHNSLYLEAYR